MIQCGFLGLINPQLVAVKHLPEHAPSRSLLLVVNNGRGGGPLVQTQWLVPSTGTLIYLMSMVWKIAGKAIVVDFGAVKAADFT